MEVSENLKQIITNDTLNSNDIFLVTSLVEKIIDSLKVTQTNENQVQLCSDLYLEVRCYTFLLFSYFKNIYEKLSLQIETYIQNNV